MCTAEAGPIAYPLGGTRSIHDWGGGPTELHIANPKTYMSLKFAPPPPPKKKTPGIKIFHPKKLQDLNNTVNTDLFNQTDFKTSKKYVTDLLTQKNTKGVNFKPKNM